MMADTEIDREFIQKQKERLEESRVELRRIADGMEEDIRDRGEDEGDFTEHDSSDMSRSIFTREMDATVGNVMEGRLDFVERALQKIEEGTYGFSDVSGEQISKGRLEAVPEAIYKVDEQQDFENGRRYRQEINEDSQPPLS
jgi:DnaK suppressor protein